MSQTKRQVLNIFKSMVIGYVTLLGLLVISEFVFLRILPASYWFEYESVTPTKDRYHPNEDLFFISKAEVKRPVLLTWNDILYCDFGTNENGFKYYSLYKSEKYYAEPKIMTGEGGWLYPNHPQRDAVCFLDSTTTANIGYGLKKKQNLVSGPFFFGDFIPSEPIGGHTIQQVKSELLQDSSETTTSVTKQ